jgi:pilus assembly protein CpaB
MNRRLLTTLFCAFVVAALCAFMVNRMVGSRLSAVSQPTTTPVIAAAGDIKLGTILTAANLTTVQIAGPLPKGAILKRELAIGRGVVANLYQGEPILDERLAAAGAGGGLAATIKQGMRACAVKVDEVVGVAGFVTPGERVDVLISGTPTGTANPAEGSRVRTLLQNLEVLSAGTDIQKDGEGKPQQVQVVNLLVTPEQAEILSLASSQMHIQLVLRNPLDTAIATPPGTAVDDLFVSKNPAKSHAAATSTSSQGPVKAPKPPVYTIEVINGATRSSQSFAAPGGIQ